MSLTIRIGLMVGCLCLFGVLTAPVLADEIQHEHPDEATDDSDLEAVQQWLGGRMSQVHVDCAEGIEIGSFDACEDLDEDYEELLDRYATVESDRESEADTAERFNETRNQQQEYAELREEFEATFEEYEAARAADNDAEARALARELQRLAFRIEALGGELETNFIELNDATPTELSTAAASINESTAEVRTVRLAVESESFDETNITATVGATASFAEPATVSGTVTRRNGTGIDAARVLVSDGAQSFRTTTAPNGSYEVAYRPAVTPVGRTNLSVQYLPARGEPYLRSETATTTGVRPTTASLDVEPSSTQLAFSEQLSVSGDVQAAGRSAPDVSVAFRSDAGQGVTASSRTDADGSFRVTDRIPATMETGTQTITLQASTTGRALRPSRDSIEVTIAETATELRLTATATDGRVNISGRLTAETDALIGSWPVSIQLGDERYSVQTDETGRYSLSVEPSTIPESVTVTYSGANTNLGPSRAEATLAADGGATTETLSALDEFKNSLLTAIEQSPRLFAVSGILLVGVVVIAGRRLRGRAAADTSREPAVSDQPVETKADSESTVSSPSVERLLETARSKLQTDPQTAVYASYAAIRALVDASATQTHWEFYEANQQTVDASADDALQTLTEAFERAAFAADEIEIGDAETAIEAAERYLDSASRDGSTD